MAIKEPKSELCAKIVQKMQENFDVTVTKKLTTQFVQALEELVTKDYVAAAVENNEDIQIHMFSSILKVQLIAAHPSRDPRNGNDVQVPLRVAVRLNTPPRDAHPEPTADAPTEASTATPEATAEPAATEPATA